MEHGRNHAGLFPSAFLWLIAALISSAIWVGIPSPNANWSIAASIGVSVALQELMRYAYYLLICRAEPGLKIASSIATVGDGQSANAAAGHVGPVVQRSDAFRHASYALAG